MDPLAVIEQIGGGLSAVVIVALALANFIQYSTNNKLQETLLNTVLTLGRENRELLESTKTALTANTEAIRQLTAEARR